MILFATMVMVQETAPKIVVQLNKTVFRPNETVSGKVIVTFPGGLHGYQNPPTDVYQNPLKVAMEGKTFRIISAKYPVGTDYTLPGTKDSYRVYLGETTVPITVKAPSKPGNYPVSVNVLYQQCSDTTCFPPTSAIRKVILKVERKKV